MKKKQKNKKNKKNKKRGDEPLFFGPQRLFWRKGTSPRSPPALKILNIGI